MTKNIIEHGQVDKNIIEQCQVDKNIIEQAQDQKTIIIVCKDERDWINFETGFPYVGFEMWDINMITIKNIDKFKNSKTVLDDMGSEFSRHIKYFYTEGRHNKNQMIVMCHKPAQIDNMSRMNCDNPYITTYNGPDLFQDFNTTFKCDHKFHEIISGINSSYYNFTNGMADELRYGMIKYNVKEHFFIIIDKNRTMIFDSRVGLLDLKALILKDELDSKEIDKFIAYMRPLMINATALLLV